MVCDWAMTLHTVALLASSVPQASPWMLTVPPLSSAQRIALGIAPNLCVEVQISLKPKVFCTVLNPLSWLLLYLDI